MPTSEAMCELTFELALIRNDNALVTSVTFYLIISCIVCTATPVGKDECINSATISCCCQACTYNVHLGHYKLCARRFMIGWLDPLVENSYCFVVKLLTYLYSLSEFNQESIFLTCNSTLLACQHVPTRIIKFGFRQHTHKKNTNS